MELKFELARNDVNVAVNGYFQNAYSYQAYHWEQINHSVGTLRSGATPPGGAKIAFLSDKVGLNTYTGTAADSEYRRGAYCTDATKDTQTGSSWPGFWIRQTNVLEAKTYTFKIRIRNFTDRSVALGLPANSSYIEVRAGSTGGTIQYNSNGDKSDPLTVAGDLACYITFYACEALIEYVEIIDPASTSFTEYENPFGWRDIKETIEPDEILVGVFRRFVQGVTFWGDGYSFIKDYYDDFGERGSINCNIYSRANPVDSWSLEFEGVIYFDSAVWYPNKCLVELVIEAVDNIGYFSRNALSEFNIWDSYSVNGKYIGSIPLVNSGGTGLTIDSTSLGTVANFNAWYLHDVMEFAVAYVSDGQLSFSSPDLGGTNNGYGSNGDYSTFCIITGFELRKNTGQPTYISVKDLFESVLSVFGLYAVISGTTVTLKKLEDLYDGTNSSLTLNNIPDVEEMNYDEIRYKTITFGFDEWDNESYFDVHGQITWKFDGENTSGGSLAKISKILASTSIMESKVNESSTTSQYFEFDKNWFFISLLAHTTYQSGTIPATSPYNVTAVNNCNALIYPWEIYGRHRKNIYESPNLANSNGDISGGLYNVGHYLDFKDSNPSGTGIYTTWFKFRPGTSADYYFKFLYKFNYPLSCTDRDDILSNFEYHILISIIDSGHTKTWIKRIEREFSTGLSEIEVFSE